MPPKRTRRRKRAKPIETGAVKVISSNGTIFGEQVVEATNQPKVQDVEVLQTPLARKVPEVTGADLAKGVEPSTSNSTENTKKDSKADNRIPPNTPAKSAKSTNNHKRKSESAKVRRTSSVSDQENSTQNSKKDSETDDELPYSNAGRSLNHYTLEFKLKVVEKAKKTSNREAAR